MAAGLDLPEETTAVGRGIAMEFPVGVSPTKLPNRLRRRLLETEGKSSSPTTVEEIEAKLRHAHHRRQIYYERLSSKARAKPRSPSRCSSQEEELGQRLEAKLQAAEQKRLSLLTKAQMRLARLDELRQAAKTGVQMRYENERAKLGTKVESRVQQAEANRMHILKAYRQRRASLRERSSQSLMRRIARESKYKECVRAAIHQKRVAAETKRLRLLEAEKKKAHARISQVKHVAKSVSHQREIERRKKKDQLEDRLQRARRQRAEYLRQRGRLHGYAHENWYRMSNQAEYLSRKLARCWRRFLMQERTTFALAKAYDMIGINDKSVKSMPFEQLALLIESASTIQTVKALVDRIESRLKVYATVSPSNYLSTLDNIDHLLKRVATPKKRTPRSSVRSSDARKVDSVSDSNKSLSKLSRYPVRIVLCAYMILGHPDAVFSGMGEREIDLAKSAQEFVCMFECFIKVILYGPISDEESNSEVIKRYTFRSQLAAFDKAWCSYLNCFVLWKVKDARSLEEDLVRAACQLEASMIQTCKLTPEGASDHLTHDMKAIQHQVTEDQKLLREKVQHLSGDAGIERMESALSETRARYFRVGDNNESPVRSPMTQSMLLTTPLMAQSVSPTPTPLPTVAISGERNILDESNLKTKRVVRSLFKETTNSPGGSSFSVSRTSSENQLASYSGKMVTENEVIVNEFLHEHHRSLSDGFDVDQIQNSIEGKIKQTMEKAFWDSVMESVKQEQPNYDQIVQLMREVRDEICEMAPQSWKEDIFSAIDLEILSQVLISGNLDVDYLGQILEFSLVSLQKLSAPANEEIMKATHQKLFSELSKICQSKDESNNVCVIALVKGLQFVLEQIQILKKEISRARIRLMEPLVKGPAGLDYLRNAFAKRYGSPSDANTSLPSTLRWLSSVWNCKDQEWEEHVSLSSALVDSSSQELLPSTTLRTGGNIMIKTIGSSQMALSPDGANATGNQQHQPECKGEPVDLAVRLGLLKLVSGISGLTQEDLQETLSLNFTRLRSVQAQVQKIIVISTSILICRQILLSEKAVNTPTDMDNMVYKCASQLSDLFDRVEDTDIKDIVEVICNLVALEGGEDAALKLKSMKEVTARMLGKSLQAGDAVFERVSNAVYSALRGATLGGRGPHGRRLAEMALLKIGAGVLTERVVEAAGILIVVATISVSVHGPWYKYLTDNI
ncbi:putative T-complex 11 protein [Lupinus albus]|uniref:Putative T-complex 11 protein n=1 Tax=Lupinus albus TaxID=3870 RepID=A0A6A4NX00_LUPAL|nr:putative T-complex 11 protein [Lupinus albus]